MEIAYNTDAGFSFFLNLYGCPLPNSIVNDGLVEVNVEINEEAIPVIASVCQGNQRILLPETAAQLIIQSLLNEDAVFVRVGNYRVILPHDGFDVPYNKMVQLI